MKPHLINTLLVASLLPSLSWSSHMPILKNFDTKITPFDLIAEGFQLTINTDIEKTLLSEQPLVLSLPGTHMRQLFAIDFDVALPVFSTTQASNLLLGTHFSFSPEKLKIKDAYFGFGIPLGKFKYGVLSTLQNNPLTGFWKGSGANNIYIYERFDAPLKNSFAFESANWRGFSFRAIKGTSGYLTGIKNNLEWIISDIPAKGGSIEYQQGGFLVRYTALTKEQNLDGSRKSSALTTTTTSTGSSSRKFPSIPGYNPTPPPSPETAPSDLTTADTSKNTTNYKQKRIEIAYKQNNLSLCIGYQHIQSKEGWGDVSSVSPVLLSQEKTESLKDVIKNFNILREEPGVKITWPNFKTHEILASADYVIGKIKPKISFVYGKIDEESFRKIGIDFSACNSSICGLAKLAKKGGANFSQPITMPNYTQYLIGIDYLLNSSTTVGTSFGQINWDNKIIVPEIDEWQNKKSIGLHVSHTF